MLYCYLQGTPDDERVRRYRQGRDLTAAMRLRIEEGDDTFEEEETSSDAGGATTASESDHDSVISASTRVTASEAASSTAAAVAARRTGRAAARQQPASSNASLESEEVGYASDRVRHTLEKKERKKENLNF